MIDSIAVKALNLLREAERLAIDDPLVKQLTLLLNNAMEHEQAVLKNSWAERAQELINKHLNRK